MRIGVPLRNGKVCRRFADADELALFTTDEDGREVALGELAIPPIAHHDVSVAWVEEHGAGTIVAGEMDAEQASALRADGVEVALGLGADGDDPVEIARAHLARLERGPAAG